MMDDNCMPWPFSGIEQPLENDVVYGRGGLANHHEGNRRFRALVSKFKEQYQKCSRHEKTAMAEALVQQWRQQTPPGRFLKINNLSGLWDDVGKKARSKCSQLLREGRAKVGVTGKTDSEDNTASEEEDQPVPPPPPPPPMNDAMMLETPPQSKLTKKPEANSPCSVMNMPFHPCEVEENPFEKVFDGCADDEFSVASEAASVFSNMLNSIKLPQIPCRRPIRRSSSTRTKSQGADVSALSNFLRNIIKEKAPAGNETKVEIFQDNPITSPASTKAAAVQNESVIASTPCPMVVDIGRQKVSRSRCSSAGSDVHANISIGDLTPEIKKLPPRPKRAKVSRDVMPIEICVRKRTDSEHSTSWKSLDFDFDDDPVFSKYASRLGSGQSVSSARSRKTTLSHSSNSSSLMSILEDLGSLGNWFRDRSASADTGSSPMSALQWFEAKYRMRGNPLDPDDDQPELDDMSLGSSCSFEDDENDEAMEPLDGPTRHTVLSIDSSTLEEMMAGL